MKYYSFYHRETGVIHPRRFGTDDTTQVVCNAPADHLVIEGHHDHLSKRVDITLGALIDYQPPAPSAEHEWNADTKRWALTAAAQAKVQAKVQAHHAAQAVQARIAALVASQHGHVRGHCLGKAGAAEALQAIDDEIEALERGLDVGI